MSLGLAGNFANDRKTITPSIAEGVMFVGRGPALCVSPLDGFVA